MFNRRMASTEPCRTLQVNRYQPDEQDPADKEQVQQYRKEQKPSEDSITDADSGQTGEQVD